MGEELKQTYTIRIPQEVATRMEEVARTHGITPTALIQSLLMRKFARNRRPSSCHRRNCSRRETGHPEKELRFARTKREGAARFEQLRFEIVKTRSARLHSVDQTLSAAVVDQIIEASEQTARGYTAGLASTAESKS